MKALVTLCFGMFIFSICSYGQQNLFKKDSTLSNFYHFNYGKLSDSGFIGKASTFNDDFKFNLNHKTVKNDMQTELLDNYNMPTYFLKGNYKLRVVAADTTTNYSLRVISPDAIKY